MNTKPNTVDLIDTDKTRHDAVDYSNPDCTNVSRFWCDK